ncbi:hypothetical protein HHI36_002395 [Cryptolaemus montrouzieri]|uniref:Uncharacterized protein n=1 Tax=Cryptolaemus montrouzieri TaxID=559131 RepID=A0ABD2PAH9_9CUCU
MLKEKTGVTSGAGVARMISIITITPQYWTLTEQHQVSRVIKHQQSKDIYSDGINAFTTLQTTPGEESLIEYYTKLNSLANYKAVRFIWICMIRTNHSNRRKTSSGP